MEVQIKNDKFIVAKLNKYFPNISEKIKIIPLYEVIGLAIDTIKKLLEGKGSHSIAVFYIRLTISRNLMRNIRPLL